MAGFRSRLIMERPLGDSAQRFILNCPLHYESDLLGWLTVPEGFETDLSSIPRLLWRVLPPVDSYDAAGVVHDLLYREQICDRKTADRVMLEAMETLGVPRWKRYAVYSGLRIGGWLVWQRYARKLSEAFENVPDDSSP